MRVSANSVRLAGLVAAATASGYLWRAALEPGHTVPTIIRVAPASIPEIPLAPERHAPTPRPLIATRPRSRPHTVGRQTSSRADHVSPHVAAPASHTFSSDAVPSRPVAKPKPKPKPKPAPKPSPAPTPPPVETPAPAAQPAGGAPVSPPAPASTPPTEGTDSTKPGWGNGDKNHDHGGPPGDKHG